MEPMRKEKAFYLRILTRDIKIDRSKISCCGCLFNGSLRLSLSLQRDLTLLLLKSTFGGVDIEPPVMSSFFLASPDCFDKQLTQQGQIHSYVCPFSTWTKFWQSYSRKTRPILGAKLVAK